MAERLTRRQLIQAGAAGAAATALPTTAFAASRRKTKRADVAVIGAGFSGLAAARALVAKGHSVVVLEARDRVGGRTQNAEIAGGKAIAEIGGEFVGPTQDRILALAKAVGVATFPVYNTGSNVFLARGARATYDAGVGIPNDAEVQAGLGALLEVDAIGKAVGVAAPWKHRKAKQYDGQTLAHYLSTKNLSPTALAVLGAVCEAIWGADPDELSLLYVAQYVAAAGNAKTAGSFVRLIATGGGAQEQRLVGGSVVIAEKVAHQLGSSRVILGAPVEKLREHDGVVRITTRGGPTVVAKRAIVAVPPVLAARIAYAPGLPSSKKTILKAMVPGSLTKVEAVYDTPFWREKGLSGQGVSDTGLARVPYDNSPPEERRGLLLVHRRQAPRRVGRAVRSGPPRPRPGRLRPLHRRRACPHAERVPREGLDDRDVDARLSGRPLRTRRALQARRPAARRARPHPLRGHRDLGLLAGLHGRRGARGGARGARGPRAAVTPSLDTLSTKT